MNHDMAQIKQDASQIEEVKEELARLRQIIDSTSGPNYIMRRYLDGLTTYAETVCNDSAGHGDYADYVGSLDAGEEYECSRYPIAATLGERVLTVIQKVTGIRRQRIEQRIAIDP